MCQTASFAVWERLLRNYPRGSLNTPPLQNPRLCGDDFTRELSRFELDCAEFEFGNLAERIERFISQQVCRRFVKAEGDEDFTLLQRGIGSGVSA